MNRYDNYSPEIPVREEVPAAPKADKESSQRRQKEPRRRRPKADTQKKKESPKINPQRVATLKLIFGLLLGAVALYLGVAFISYFTECVRDQASISAAPIGTAKDIGNAAGEGGARLAERPTKGASVSEVSCWSYGWHASLCICLSEGLALRC